MATTIDRLPGSMPVSEVSYHGSAALYGRSGTGKTTLSSTWPKPILFLNIKDNGTDSISDVEDIDVKHINTTEELHEVILWLHKQAQRGKLIYKTVVLDTMTQLQGIMINELGEELGIKKKTGKAPGDFGSLRKQDWGKISGDLKAVIMDIRNLPVESVFIAQERIFNMGDEEDDGVNMLMPEVGNRLMPSVNSDLCASVSIIGNTFIRLKVTKDRVKGSIVRTVEKQYCLRIGPNEVYTTKLRKPKGITVPDYIIDPNYTELKAIMKGKLNGSQIEKKQSRNANKS
jgi:hypothetical protein